jgi:SAM-dependent methyltransferase
MLALPYDDACFDCVVDIVSSQHLTFADHVPLYRGIWRVLKPGGLFFSYHLGQKSFSFKHGGGKLIDRFTIDNIRNSKAPLNNNGITCFPSEGATETLLIKAGFGSVSIENVIKTYDERRIMLQYLVIRTKK